jgi:hypothetical protein
VQGSIREWLFKGLSVEAALDELEDNGVAIRAATDPAALQRVMPLEDFSASIRTSAMEALESYLAFHCFENAARELITERLSEAHGSEWWTQCASRPLREKVSSRQQQEDANRWHMKRGAAEIYYTDFGDLALLIKNNWTDFEDLFPDQNWIVGRFSELEKSRNIVAHNNTLEKHERDRIKLYLRDWQKQVG